jgi:hypothetical protein
MLPLLDEMACHPELAFVWLQLETSSTTWRRVRRRAR